MPVTSKRFMWRAADALRILACLLVWGFANQAFAAGLTGRALQGWSEESKTYDPKETPHPAYSAGRLNGYLIGLADTLALVRGFCPPPGFGEKELQQLVEKRLQHDYASRDQRITPHIVKILQQTYPCPPLQRKKPQAREQNI